MKILLLLVALCSSQISAIPAVDTKSSVGCTDHAGGDPDFVTSCSALAASITFPNGIAGRPGGIVLLVHGTGSKGGESWSGSPYNSYLTAKGYDIAWIDLPLRSLGDAQISAEYVAYNIPKLAKKSKTGKVSVIGHSQGGGFNIQWALLYWPHTTQHLTSAYIALAGDFHGTTVTPLICDPQAIARGGCQPSVWQQTAGSHYIAAQNKRGGRQLVPTTSIRTTTDEVVVPESPAQNASPYLPGATNIALQDICGPLYYEEHIGMLIDATAFALAVDALQHGGHANPSRINSSSTCTAVLQEFVEANDAAKALILGAIALPTAPLSKTEPLLQRYVCKAGDAPKSQCS